MPGDTPATRSTPSPALQESKARFLGAMIDNRIDNEINRLLEEFSERCWPDAYYVEFFTRLAAKASATAERFRHD